MKHDCGNEMTPKEETISQCNWWCDECGGVVAIIYGLPSQIQRATERLEGKEMVDTVISILEEYKLVTPMSHATL